jgi:hypothetical protein
MNPPLFADWSRIHRIFRRTMWLVAMVLAVVIWAAVSLGVPGARAGHAQSYPIRHLTLLRHRSAGY